MSDEMLEAVNNVGDKMDKMDGEPEPMAKPKDGEPESSMGDLDSAYEKLKTDDPEAAKGLAAAESAMGGPDMVKAMLKDLYGQLETAEDKMGSLKTFAHGVSAGPTNPKPDDMYGPLGKAMAGLKK